MRDEMTELSRINFDEATSGLKTVREAVDFLEENARIRTFREKLEKFYAGDDLRKIIHIEQMVLPDAGGMNMLKKMERLITVTENPGSSSRMIILLPCIWQVKNGTVPGQENLLMTMVR